MNRTNEEKLELFADLLEPVGAILSDEVWARLWYQGDRFGAIRAAIKGHTEQVVEILARIEGEDPATYQIDGMAMFFKLAALFNRPDLDGMAGSLFTSQPQTADDGPSGAATETTRDGAN